MIKNLKNISNYFKIRDLKDQPEVQLQVFFLLQSYLIIDLGRNEADSKKRINEVKSKLLNEEGFSKEEVQDVEKNMIFLKSLADVRKSQDDLKEKMKPKNLEKVQSKV